MTFGINKRNDSLNLLLILFLTTALPIFLLTIKPTFEEYLEGEYTSTNVLVGKVFPLFKM